MWLNTLLLIVSLITSDLITVSSYHLCAFAFVDIDHSFTSISLMCFAKTKTLKSLRSLKENQNLSSDLGFNWEDNCDYLPYDAIETFQHNNNYLNIVQLNIRGLKGKLTDLNNLLVKLKRPGIIILNETWLKDDDTKKINIPNYKYEGFPQKNKKGGGVGFLIRSDITYRCRKDLEANNAIPSCEHCYTEIKNNKENVVVGSIYRPPNTNVNDFIETFSEHIGKITSNSECIIGLDHNLDLLKLSVHPKTQEFLECILDHNLLPAITKPTRVSKTSATLIDNILLSKILQPEHESLIIIDDLSDHLPCLVSLKNFQHVKTNNSVMKRIINSSAINKIKEDLIKVDWNKTILNKNASDSFHSFHQVLMKVMDRHAPEKLVRENIKKKSTLDEQRIKM